jgi:signal transduction histidine kinase
MEPTAQPTLQTATPTVTQPSLAGTTIRSISSRRLPLPGFGSLPTLREEGGDALVLAGLAHDARNLVTALGLCAELMAEPGVLAPQHAHFAAEIHSITEASTRLVERLSNLGRRVAEAKENPVQEAPITDLSAAVQQMNSLLTAIAGPVTDVQIACLPCHGQLRLSEESLSRILVNLVRNAADAMPTGGRIRVTSQLGGGGSFMWTLDGETETEQSAQYLWDDAPHAGASTPQTVVLTVEDDGPGIPTEFLERVFDAGFSTHHGQQSWPEARHRGLGLSIVRELVEKAGGTVRAVTAPMHGARFEIELPLTNVTPPLPWEPSKNGQRES